MMGHSPRAPALRRSLLDRPQQLGICPTLWFWSDWDRQRLLIPLVLAIAVPVAPLMHWLTVHFQWSIWPLVIVNTLYPFAVMGVIERQIRHLRDPNSARKRTNSPPPGPLVLFSGLTVLSVLLLMTFTAPQAGGAAVLVLLTVLAGAALAIALLPRTGRAARLLALRPGALRPSAPSSATWAAAHGARAYRERRPPALRPPAPSSATRGPTPSSRRS